MARRPRGYIGTRHETIGSDILAVLRALTLPEQILGAAAVRDLETIDPDGWYPIGKMLDFMAIIERTVGDVGLRKVGRTLFKLSHEERLKEVARSARDVIYGIDGMYHHANRGVAIGGWRVRSFSPGAAELEKTTPHPCMLEEGILGAALRAVGAPATITQDACMRTGADHCLFVISSSITDARWMGEG